MDISQTFLGDNLDIDQLIVVVGLMLGLLVVILGFLLTGGGPRKQLKRRMDRVKHAGEGGAQRVQSEVVSIKRSTAFSANKILDELIKRFIPRPENLRQKLSRAGLKTTLGVYLLINLIVGLAAFGGFGTIPIVPNAAAALLGVLVGVGLPYAGIVFLAARRKRKFVDGFPEAIDLMVRGIKSGLPITETVKVVGDELPDPVGVEFRGISDAVRFGQKLDEALWETSKRLEISEFNFFTVSLAIQAETGGNLAETLANLSEVLRRRRQMKLKIKAFASEPKASAYIIGSLPFVMFGLIYMMSPDYVMKLFSDPRGWMMIAVGMTSFLIGITVMIKMVRFEI